MPCSTRQRTLSPTALSSWPGEIGVAAGDGLIVAIRDEGATLITDREEPYQRAAAGAIASALTPALHHRFKAEATATAAALTRACGGMVGVLVGGARFLLVADEALLVAMARFLLVGAGALLVAMQPLVRPVALPPAPGGPRPHGRRCRPSWPRAAAASYRTEGGG